MATARHAHLCHVDEYLSPACALENGTFQTVDVTAEAPMSNIRRHGMIREKCM